MELSFEDIPLQTGGAPGAVPGGATAGPFDDIPVDAPQTPDWGAVLTHGVGAGLKGALDVNTAIGAVARGQRPPLPAEEADPTGRYLAQPWANPLQAGGLALDARKAVGGLAESLPEMAVFSGGAAAGLYGGTVAGTVLLPGLGSVAGGAIGTILGGGSAVAGYATLKSLAGLFKTELAETPDDPDAAYARAVNRAALGGVIEGTAFAAFGARPFAGTIKNLVFQAAGLQPAIAVGGKVADNALAGAPLLEGTGDAAIGGVVGTSLPLGAHKVVVALRGRGGAGGDGGNTETGQPARQAADRAVERIEPYFDDIALETGNRPEAGPESTSTLPDQPDLPFGPGDAMPAAGDDGQPDLAQPDPGQADPGQADPGQADPGPSDPERALAAAWADRTNPDVVSDSVPDLPPTAEDPERSAPPAPLTLEPSPEDEGAVQQAIDQALGSGRATGKLTDSADIDGARASYENHPTLGPLIRIARDLNGGHQELLSQAAHEITHAAEDIGLLSRGDVLVLARRGRGLMRAGEIQRYVDAYRAQDPALPKSALAELLRSEQAARAVEAYAAGAFIPRGAIAKVLIRVQLLGEAIVNAAQGRGLKTARGVAGDLLSGRLRDRQAEAQISLRQAGGDALVEAPVSEFPPVASGAAASDSDRMAVSAPGHLAANRSQISMQLRQTAARQGIRLSPRQIRIATDHVANGADPNAVLAGVRRQYSLPPEDKANAINAWLDRVKGINDPVKLVQHPDTRRWLGPNYGGYLKDLAVIAKKIAPNNMPATLHKLQKHLFRGIARRLGVDIGNASVPHAFVERIDEIGRQSGGLTPKQIWSRLYWKETGREPKETGASRATLDAQANRIQSLWRQTPALHGVARGDQGIRGGRGNSGAGMDPSTPQTETVTSPKRRYSLDTGPVTGPVKRGPGPIRDVSGPMPEHVPPHQTAGFPNSIIQDIRTKSVPVLAMPGHAAETAKVDTVQPPEPAAAERPILKRPKLSMQLRQMAARQGIRISPQQIREAFNHVADGAGPSAAMARVRRQYSLSLDAWLERVKGIDDPVKLVQHPDTRRWLGPNHGGYLKDLALVAHKAAPEEMASKLNELHEKMFREIAQWLVSDTGEGKIPHEVIDAVNRIGISTGGLTPRQVWSRLHWAETNRDPTGEASSPTRTQLERQVARLNLLWNRDPIQQKLGRRTAPVAGGRLEQAGEEERQIAPPRRRYSLDTDPATAQAKLGFAPLEQAFQDYIDHSRRVLTPRALSRALKIEPQDAAAMLERAAHDGIIQRTGGAGFERVAVKEPETLLQFLGRTGGIQDEAGELRAMGIVRKPIPGYGNLVRRIGRSLDYAREAAAEAGYPVGDDVASFLEAVRTEHDGRKVYSHADTGEMAEYMDRQRALAAQDEYAARGDASNHRADMPPDPVDEISPDDLDALWDYSVRDDSTATSSRNQSLNAAGRASLYRDLRRRLDAKGLGRIGLKFANRVEALIGGRVMAADGGYFRRLITLAMDAPDIAHTLGHEEIHAARDLGLFTPKEWGALTAHAGIKTYLKDPAFQAAYGHLPRELQLEECVAHLKTDRDAGKLRNATPYIGRLLDKLSDLLEVIRNAFLGRGFRSAEGIFRAMDDGRLAQREQNGALLAAADDVLPGREPLFSVSRYLRAPQGGFEFGQISPKVAQYIGQQPGAIVLQRGH